MTASYVPDIRATGYAVRISLIAALGGFLFGFETAVISGAEKTIQQLWSLSTFWQGFTVAASLIGTGACIYFYLARNAGNKRKNPGRNPERSWHPVVVEQLTVDR